MEVTRKEDLGWEVNLAAHVSEVLLTFITSQYILVFLNLYITETFKKDLLCKWTLLSNQALFVYLISLSPIEPPTRHHRFGGLLGTTGVGEESYA